MNSTEKNKLPKHITAISFLTLLAFFVAFFSHSEHLTQYNTNVEQQDCHICQQGVDTPPKAIKQSEIFLFAFDVVITSGFSELSVKPYYGMPQLRAPPNFS